MYYLLCLVVVGQDDGSSVPSEQSKTPSQIHVLGKHSVRGAQ